MACRIIPLDINPDANALEIKKLLYLKTRSQQITNFRRYQFTAGSAAHHKTVTIKAGGWRAAAVCGISMVVNCRNGAGGVRRGREEERGEERVSSHDERPPIR